MTSSISTGSSEGGRSMEKGRQLGESSPRHRFTCSERSVCVSGPARSRTRNRAPPPALSQLADDNPKPVCRVPPSGRRNVCLMV